VADMTMKDFIERYGLPLGVLLAFALVLVLLPGNKPDSVETTGDATVGVDASDGSGALAEGADPASVDTGAGTGAAAAGAGGTAGGAGGTTGGTTGAAGSPSGGGQVVFGKGPDCDSKGQQIGISPYMPPCVQWTGTNNGGATARGVTAKSIKVVSWLGQETPGTREALTAAELNDSPAVVDRAFKALVKYSNAYYQTYGRKVDVVQMQASGKSTNDAAMKADAVKIADEFKAFAVFAGNALAPIPTVLARELAQRGVVCICTTSLTSAFYNELPATIFSSLPTLDEYAAHGAEYAAKKLAGKNADFGGAGTKGKKRVFCLMHIAGVEETVDPEALRGAKVVQAAFKRVGITFKTTVSYLYNPGANADEITNMVAKLKSEGCTTVVPIVDPIQPILITKEATKQIYFPEWYIVGTGLSDTSTIGRFYDEQQWTHAFGISPLWVTWDKVENSSGYREYHDAMPGSPKGEEGVLINIYRAPVQTLFRGIHMAGPNLNNQTFAQGIFSLPRLGGIPASPLVYVTRQYPTEIKDFSEVWWDANRVGPDERSRNGKGQMVRADGGRRYTLGRWPGGNPSRANGVTVTAQQGVKTPPPRADRYTKPCLSCT
jgi:hypothetical protein